MPSSSHLRGGAMTGKSDSYQPFLTRLSNLISSSSMGCEKSVNSLKYTTEDQVLCIYSTKTREPISYFIHQ